jgi:homoprotocatechuate degradation regulator HpaR
MTTVAVNVATMGKPRTARATNAAPALRPFARSLPMALLKAREGVMARFRPMLREYDLTEQQWRVLRALADAGGPLRFGEVARRTWLSPPSLSRLVKALEDRAFVARRAAATDLRAAQLALSPSGRRLVARVGPRSERIYAGIGKDIGAEDLETLYALLELVERRLSGDP